MFIADKYNSFHWFWCSGCIVKRMALSENSTKCS